MKNYLSTPEIKIGLDFGTGVIPVGRLATRDHKTYFEYDASFLKSGLEISPLRLPLKPGLSAFEYDLFEGLPGVFNDSLPDGWGRLLFDRYARSQGILPSDVSPLERLAHVGAHGMGALVYEPDHSLGEEEGALSLDRLAEQAQDVMDGRSEDVLQLLLNLNGSSAGARPKALIGVDKDRKNISHGIRSLPEGYEPWLVKFANTHDGSDAGVIEYVYAQMAKEAGIHVPDVHLFPAQQGAGYFAIKRFDRDGQKRFHMHTACGLLHSDFRTPSLDYEDLLALTGILTRDVREVEKMFSLAVFNVLAHNRDDHAKNFSYLMDEKGQWKLSPAYDLTFSSGPRMEQSTSVMGEGKNPNVVHLKKLGEGAGLPEGQVSAIIEQTKAALATWSEKAGEYGVSRANIDLIGKKLSERN
ncbi:MAG: type II toxin-antitoxin system HipA family toxin [Alphaproteobacteria bacterium]|nr:type II toxin-antitoxin system HipA family toxin [Alphaproteobacteria bacterium]